jgi:hypothetical protein|tara:strand:+ start:728 stop:964 length:237 start_codon:yes stop_codon:yes gene_type:complete
MANHMTFTNTFKVQSIERLKNSRNGNPKFKFNFDNGMEMVTPTDAGWVYALVPSQIEGTTIKIKYKTARKHYEILGIA